MNNNSMMLNQNMNNRQQPQNSMLQQPQNQGFYENNSNLNNQHFNQGQVYGY